MNFPRPGTLLFEEKNGCFLELFRNGIDEFVVVMYNKEGKLSHDYTLYPHHRVFHALSPEFEKIRNSRWSRDFKPKAWEIVRVAQILES